MPTNLPPEYVEADRRFREARTTQEKISALEDLISRIPKHKGTDKIRGEYRRKLSKLKTSAQSKKKTGKHDSHFHIEKEGSARVVVLGAANVGKSSLVSTLTNAKPEISEQPFSTWVPTPGIMDFNGVQIQIIDTPPLDRNFIEPEFLDLIKSCDLILLMLDIKDYPLQELDVSVRVLSEHRIADARSKESDESSKLTLIPFVVVVNKDDDPENDEDYSALRELLADDWEIIAVSTKTGKNIEDLERRIIGELKIIRVFSKPPGKEADLTQPFVLKEGSCVEEFAGVVHKDFVEKLKSARIWGHNVYDGQQVGKDHVLFDGDIVELHI